MPAPPTQGRFVKLSFKVGNQRSAIWLLGQQKLRLGLGRNVGGVTGPVFGGTDCPGGAWRVRSQGSVRSVRLFVATEKPLVRTAEFDFAASKNDVRAVRVGTSCTKPEPQASIQDAADSNKATRSVCSRCNGEKPATNA